MKRFLAIVSGLLLLTAAIAFAKPSDYNDNSGEISATVSDSGFNDLGWNYNAHIFSGRYCDFPGASNAPCDAHLIFKWSSNFDLTKFCDGGAHLDTQAEGAWFMQIVRMADNSVDRGKVECGSENVPDYNLYGCNCHTVT